jgi:outer membrane protein
MGARHPATRAASALAGAGTALALAGAALVAPLTAKGQTLTDALVLAYRSNPSLLAERAQVRAQDEEVAQALSGWRPTVTVNGSAGRQWLTQVPARVSGEPSTAEWPRSGQLVVTQNIYKGGRIEAQTRVADYNVLAERSRLLLIEQTTLLNAALAYIGVVEAQAVLDLNTNNVQVLTKQLEATQDRFNVGEVTRTDVSQAEAQLSAAIAGREAADNQLQTARANYRNVIGEQPGHLTDPGEPAGLPLTRDDSIGLAQKQNANVLVAVYTERSAIANVDVQLSGLLPTLSLQGLLQKSEETFSKNDNTETAQILAILSLPIYTGGLVEAQVREAKQIVGARRLQLEQSQRQAIQDATTFWENLQSARSQVSSFQDQIKANEVALEGTQQEALAGLRTVLDILNAQQALLTSQVSLVTAHHDAIQAAYNLLNSVGMLSARDRQLPVEFYDPTVHYKDVRNKWHGVGDPVQ